MRKVKLRYVALALVAVALAAPAAGTTKTGANEGKLTMIAWEGYLDAKWVKPFEQQSGCKVQAKYAGSSDEMVTLMRSGGGGQYDMVSASGDATLSYEAGFEVREPDAPVFGSLNFVIEHYDADAAAKMVMADVHARLAEKGGAYGLVRHDGFLMHFPGKNLMLANVTHFETPLDPMATGQMVIDGRAQADRVIGFLRAEFPEIFSHAQIRAYGTPGIRQTRWIAGRHQLTLAEVKAAVRPADAVARCAWWVELHDAPSLVHWEKFAPDHVYYIPLGCMVPKEADNVVAAGRCVDADLHALSAIRVIGPCIAMGAAAAHALDLAGPGPVHAVDLAALQGRLTDNLDRRD